jgi:hypothetical protein
MKAFRPTVLRVAVSPLLTPCVLGIFLLLYVATVFFGSGEPLASLVDLTGRSTLLLALLSLVPLNLAARLVAATLACYRRGRALSGEPEPDVAGLFEEMVPLPPGTDFTAQSARLQAMGYRTRVTAHFLSARRGLGLFPARFLLILGGCLLFLGILLSLSGRVSQREPVVEGEPLPHSNDLVQQIVLREEPGLFLARSLEIVVAGEGGGMKSFGLYPPSKHRGRFLYPRYLGVAPLIRFSAPDLPRPFEQYVMLGVYPPGREDSVEIPGSPYRLFFQLAPEQGGDPYRSGNFVLQFRLLNQEAQILTGSVRVGGAASEKGYQLALPEARRMVVTDFVYDPGVPLIWGAGIALLLSLAWWLPVRLFFPRQEMLFRHDGDVVTACSRAEGRGRGHAGRFHELLDLMQPEEKGPEEKV